MLSIVPAMHSISHHTDWVVPVLDSRVKNCRQFPFCRSRNHNRSIHPARITKWRDQHCGARFLEGVHHDRDVRYTKVADDEIANWMAFQAKSNASRPEGGATFLSRCVIGVCTGGKPAHYWHVDAILSSSGVQRVRAGIAKNRHRGSAHLVAGQSTINGAHSPSLPGPGALCLYAAQHTIA